MSTDPTISSTDPHRSATAILVPVYENAGTIESVTRDCARTGIPVFVVDDGGKDGSAEIAASLAQQGIVEEVIRCPGNLGKAGALRLGFRRLLDLGFDVAISVDADGQHDPESIPPLLEIVEADPGALVLGCRWPLHPDQPRRNLIGRFFSNLAIRGHCGIAIGDAPCGFRSWPLHDAVKVRGRSGRYAWEQEMISRMAWRGVPIRQLDIPAIYHPRETRISHYRFGRDWPEGIAIYLWLLLVALLPLPHGGWRGCRRTSTRRFDRFLSPGRLRGRRPETWTDRIFVATSLLVGLLAGLLLPASPWTAGIAAWCGWRWHAGIGAISLAVIPSLDSVPALAPTIPMVAIFGVAWLVSGLVRPPR